MTEPCTGTTNPSNENYNPDTCNKKIDYRQLKFTTIRYKSQLFRDKRLSIFKRGRGIEFGIASGLSRNKSRWRSSLEWSSGFPDCKFNPFSPSSYAASLALISSASCCLPCSDPGGFSPSTMAPTPLAYKKSTLPNS